MTRPFQYDTYVKSQIGIENDYDTLNKSHLRSTVQKHQGPFYHPQQFENYQEVSSRASLRNKINELLGMCQDENKQVSSEFNQVMGAENEILGLLKEQAARQPTPNSYINSHVQNFPNTTNGYHNQSGYGSQPDAFQAQSNYDSNYNQNQQDRAQFLRSKAQQLKQENKFLKYQTSQVGRPQDDQQIRYLQQEIARLRALLPQYQAQIKRLRQTGQGNKLIQLLDQGQIIRQQTLSLLRSNGNSDNFGDSPSNNNILAELDQLRKTCKQLQEQNWRLKQRNKGTEYTSLSRGYY